MLNADMLKKEPTAVTAKPPKKVVSRKIKNIPATQPVFSASPTPTVEKERHRLTGLLQTNQTMTGMTITPTMAELMLETNSGNRNVSPGKVSEYGAAMKRGDWRLTGEAIIFSKQGILNDGQHRLLASISAGVTFISDVRFGIERDTFDCIDIGQKRSAAQVLGIEGEKHASILAGAVRMLISYRAKNYHFNIKGVQPSIISEVLDKNPKLRESAAKASHTYAEFKLIPPTALTLSHFLFAAIDKTGADKFLFDLGTGEGMRKDDPVMALRRFAINSPVTGKVASAFFVPLLVRAWNARRAGIDIKTLRTPTDSNWSDNFQHPA